MYDASLHPREERPSLNLLDREGADLYLDAVREGVLEALETADLEGGDLLRRDGFVYHIILQHECQHNETMLQTLQLMQGKGYRPEAKVELPDGNSTDAMVHVPGGPFVMGTDDEAWTLDNERGAHEVEVADFHLDKTPLTNRAYLEFVEDGGYEREELWRSEGWARIRDQRISAPKHWYQREPPLLVDPALRLRRALAHGRTRGARLLLRGGGVRQVGRQTPPNRGRVGESSLLGPETGTKRLFPWGDEPPDPREGKPGPARLQAG